MKKMNVIVVFDNKLENTLMCKRTKEPYMGMYNLVGGKIEKENDGLNEAYRELFEETNISKNDVELKHFMNIEYVSFNKLLEVYYGLLKKEVDLVEVVVVVGFSSCLNCDTYLSNSSLVAGLPLIVKHSSQSSHSSHSHASSPTLTS